MTRVVVIDACVLYSAALRDLFLRLSWAGFFTLVWSDQILDEMVIALARTRPDIPIDRLERLKATMVDAFPRAMEAPAVLKPIGLPDPHDEHVIAAAVAAMADLLLTCNVRDFPPHVVGRVTALEVISPDAFLLRMMREDEGAVRLVVSEILADLRNPPITLASFLAGLRVHAPGFVDAFERTQG